MNTWGFVSPMQDVLQLEHNQTCSRSRSKSYTTWVKWSPTQPIQHYREMTSPISWYFRNQTTYILLFQNKMDIIIRWFYMDHGCCCQIPGVFLKHHLMQLISWKWIQNWHLCNPSNIGLVKSDKYGADMKLIPSKTDDSFPKLDENLATWLLSNHNFWWNDFLVSIF